MRASDVYTADMKTVIENFLDEDLANRVGEVLNGSKIGTVHFTLAYLMAQDIGYQAEGNAEKMAVQLISIQQFMYKVASEIVHLQTQKQAN